MGGKELGEHSRPFIIMFQFIYYYVSVWGTVSSELCREPAQHFKETQVQPQGRAGDWGGLMAERPSGELHHSGEQDRWTGTGKRSSFPRDSQSRDV